MRTLIFIFLSTVAWSQSVLHWEPEIVVSDGSVYGNTRPRIALTANDVPVVVYGKNTNGMLYVSRMEGNSFLTPVALLQDPASAYLSSWTGPDMGAKGDTVIVVYKEEPMESGYIYTRTSIDGGLTFGNPVWVDGNDTTVAWLPSMDVDALGNPTVVFMGHNTNWMHPRYFIAHSTDLGNSYNEPLDVTIDIPDEACDCCPAEYVIKGNQHALLYRNNESNIRDIYAAYSSDGGQNFPSIINVDQLDWFINSCPSTGPHGLFSNGKLLTVYSSRGTGYSRVFISLADASTNLSFTSRTIMDPPSNTNGIQNYPRISGENDTVVMVWQESDPSNPEIQCGFTTNFNLSEITNTKHIVNTVSTGSQTNPDVVYSNGFVHLVYSDGYTGSVIYRRGIIGTAGINNEDQSEILVMPNPSTDGIWKIQSEENIESIQLTDISGNAVPFVTTNVDDNVWLELKDATNGIYFLEITSTSGQTHIRKLLKQ